MAQNVSKETQQDSVKVAKSIQKPGQSKEQTKLIAQGIEKGISEYKKQQKIKARERDKQRKQQLKAKHLVEEDSVTENEEAQAKSTMLVSIVIPWLLLVLSWIIFTFYILK